MLCNNIEMKTFLDCVPVPIIVFDNNNEIISINLEVINIFKNDVDIENKPINSYIKEFFKEALTYFKNNPDEKSLCLEKSCKINKKITYFKVKFKKVETNIIVVLNDITNHKKAEIELKESKAQVHSIFENMPIMMDAIDENNNIIVWNKECESITGYSKEEMIKNPRVWEKIYPNQEYREKIVNQIKEKDCNFRDLEYDIVCKDGKVKTISWFNISKKFPIRGWHSWAFGIDVTNRKNTEKRVIKKTREFETIFEALPDLYFRTNAQGVILDCMSGIHSDFDIVSKAYIGKVIGDIVPADIKKSLSKAIYQVFKTNTLVENEFGLKEKGQLKYYESRLIPLTKDEIIIIIRDITKRKLTQEAKKRAKENMKLLNEAVEYERVRKEFFANISHEFRTPINVILGAIQLMDMYLNDVPELRIYDKLIKIKKSMKQNCYRLIRLVNNLIDITRIDSKFLELNLSNYDIVKIIKDITFSVSQFAELKSLNLEFYCNVDKKIMACDLDKIERILLNLLSNAIKFTKQGGKICVSVKHEKNEVIISIKDSGLGIKKENLEIIFERFRQVNKSLTRENEGSGIGLSLVKSLVEMHDGRIGVNSEYEKGSEFIIKMPIKLVEDQIDQNILKSIQSDKVEKVSIEFSDIYF